MKEFKLIIDGEEKVANMVTRIYANQIGLEYIYYYIKEEDDNEGTQKTLLASRINTLDDGSDEITAIESEEERELAFKLFKDSYKYAETEINKDDE